MKEVASLSVTDGLGASGPSIAPDDGSITLPSGIAVWEKEREREGGVEVLNLQILFTKLRVNGIRGAFLHMSVPQ